MERIYVDSIREFELQDLIDELIMNAEIISDRGTKEKYLKIGSGFDIETSKIKLKENDYGITSISFCYHWQFGNFHWGLCVPVLRELNKCYHRQFGNLYWKFRI